MSRCSSSSARNVSIVSRNAGSRSCSHLAAAPAGSVATPPSQTQHSWAHCLRKRSIPWPHRLPRCSIMWPHRAGLETISTPQQNIERTNTTYNAMSVSTFASRTPSLTAAPLGVAVRRDPSAERRGEVCASAPSCSPPRAWTRLPSAGWPTVRWTSAALPRLYPSVEAVPTAWIFHDQPQCRGRRRA